MEKFHQHFIHDSTSFFKIDIQNNITRYVPNFPLMDIRLRLCKIST